MGSIETPLGMQTLLAWSRWLWGFGFVPAPLGSMETEQSETRRLTPYFHTTLDRWPFFHFLKISREEVLSDSVRTSMPTPLCWTALIIQASKTGFSITSVLCSQFCNPVATQFLVLKWPWKYLFQFCCCGTQGSSSSEHLTLIWYLMDKNRWMCMYRCIIIIAAIIIIA